MRRNPLAVMQRMAALGSDVARIQMGPRRLYLLLHPDLAQALLTTRQDAFIKGRALRLTKFLLGEGLLTSEGAFHRQQRKLVLPAFHHSRLVAYGEEMVAAATRYADGLQPGQTLALDRDMMRLTLEIVARTLFDAEVGSEADEIGQALSDAITMFARTSNPLAEVLNRIPIPSTLRMRRARRRLDATIYRVIGEHRQRREDRGDLLSMLLAAQDEDTGRSMTDAQVRDEVMTLFLAGHETTAVALTWTWVLLARHPGVEARLHAELDDVLGGRRPTFADLPDLAYTRQVLSEVMRLYPPAWAFSREVVADSVDLCGYTFPRRATLIVCQYLLHRDARWWPDPERFDPDRFAPDRRTARPKCAYLPFSMGVRGCIGEQFAWAEGLLVLATLAQRWRLRLASPAPAVRPSITLRAERGLRMVAERRDTAPYTIAAH